MFGWLKEKVTQAVDARAAANAVHTEFERLEQTPGAQPRLADRLTKFVFTGEGESVVAEVAAMKNTHLGLLMLTSLHGTQKQRGLATIIDRMPQDPEVLLRLAKVYEAAQQPGTGVGYIYGAPTIPAFHGSLSWLSTFLLEVSEGGKQRQPILPAGLIMAMIEKSGEDPKKLIRGAFFYEDTKVPSYISRYAGPAFGCFHCLDQFPELVSSLAEEVKPFFRQKEATNRASLLRALLALKIDTVPFAEEIAALAVSGSKEVRESAVPLLTENFSTFKDSLARLATRGSADERFHAVRLLARLGGESEQDFLKQRLENEKSEKVSEAIREATAAAPSEHAGAEEEDLKIPPITEVPVYAPLSEEFRHALREQLQAIENATALQFNRNQLMKKYGWTRTPIPPETADRLFEALQSFVVTDQDVGRFFDNSHGVNVALLQGYPIPAEFHLIHVVRWCLLLAKPVNPSGKLGPWDLGYSWSRPLLTYQKLQKKPIDLHELAAVFRTIGLDEDAIGRTLLQQNRYMTSPLFAADANATWPYFADRLYLLEEALGFKPKEEEHRVYGEQHQRQSAFRVLKTFPRLPARLVPSLWEIALGSSKSERPLAQEVLQNIPNKEQKIVAALASRQQDARVAAAQWLSDLQYTEAIPAMKAALAKEKSDVVKDELIKSLESMGVRLEELLDLDQLAREAEKGLKKGIPNELDWFPFSQLPPVAWADSGKPVPPSIIEWLILQGYKLKNAEASPVLRRYATLFRKSDREKLGKFVLEAWIAQDTKPKYTAEQAAAEAQKEAQQMSRYAKQYPQYYPDFDEQRVYQASFNRYVTLPEGSQTGTKGILAVAGACCNGEAAATVHRYIKQWYGYRAAQGKALLQVLAWIDDPVATQVILAVANRFRTKGIQEEALRQCQLLAERKGWTMDELADRTIPTAGFDENGIMELDYGSRRFTATLSEDMSIAVTNQNGKVISSLPDANQSDDADKVKDAKSALANARKELKTVVSMQKDRLYEALCTQRTWRFEDWDTYLRQHPIVGRYCQRLVWVAYDDEKIVASFRPLADGTLSNHQDDEVKLSSATALRMGHDETLPAVDVTAWLQHFADYEVEPLFPQFGKPKYTLPDEKKEETEINDFLGHLVKAFSLRNRLTKLGYTRGASQDGGWFYDYRKRFLRLNLEAIIEFTGNGLPEENRTVALQRLYFARKLDQDMFSFAEELPLGEIPPVLLTECWNDMRMAAADGTGFAADWEKQTEM